MAIPFTDKDLSNLPVNPAPNDRENSPPPAAKTELWDCRRQARQCQERAGKFWWES
ncbi:MAG: hypothetical protein LBP75_03790 [Planctomycetota bacterium]|nr:hypothetical protein [Planctomycetota bacterium]